MDHLEMNPLNEFPYAKRSSLPTPLPSLRIYDLQWWKGISVNGKKRILLGYRLYISICVWGVEEQFAVPPEYYLRFKKKKKKKRGGPIMS